MLKPIKFLDTDSSKLFVSGCLHMGHSPKWDVPIWKLRGYNSVEEMNIGIIRQINETCLSTDVLFILGDFSLNTSYEQFIGLIKQINPKIWMVRGNHNSPWQREFHNHCIEKFGYEVIGYEWLNKITYLGDYVDLLWNKKQFVCNHYPYLIWDRVKHGITSLVSHSHGGCELTRPEDLRMKQIDCGWDVWKKPISFKEIVDCSDSKQIFKADKHH